MTITTSGHPLMGCGACYPTGGHELEVSQAHIAYQYLSCPLSLWLKRRTRVPLSRQRHSRNYYVRSQTWWPSICHVSRSTLIFKFRRAFEFADSVLTVGRIIIWFTNVPLNLKEAFDYWRRFTENLFHSHPISSGRAQWPWPLSPDHVSGFHSDVGLLAYNGISY